LAQHKGKERTQAFGNQGQKNGQKNEQQNEAEKRDRSKIAVAAIGIFYGDFEIQGAGRSGRAAENPAWRPRANQIGGTIARGTGAGRSRQGNPA
jgi:hypothetical protein